MKNKLLFFLFLLLTLSFSACKETDEPKGGSEVDGDIEYEIIPASLNFDAAGGEKEFKVYLKAPAIVESVEPSDAWCQISKSGTSPVVVTVKAAANEGEARSTSIVIKFKLGKKSASATVSITQKPADIVYTITPPSLEFPDAGGEKNFTVTVKSPATVESVESSATWCTVTKSGTSPVTVAVSVAANNTDQQRSTSLVVGMKLGTTTASATVQITQEPNKIEYTITPTSLEFPAAGGEKNFTVTVKSPATVESVESSATWCQVTKSGTSPVTVAVKVAGNIAYESRTVSVTVKMKLEEITTSATVQITQEGAKKPDEIEYTISPTSLYFPAAGGSKNFSVTIKSPATVESVESSATWCTVTKSGTSPVIVTVKASANTAYQPRTAFVTVKMKLGEITASEKVEITQEEAVEPTEIEYTISPTSLSFTSAAGEKNFTVTIKSPATVESVVSSATWCTVTKSGTTTVNVTVKVTVNSIEEQRIAYVDVNMKLGTLTAYATVKVTQQAGQATDGVWINGIKWATRNVNSPGTFAVNPEDAGMIYQWNRRVGWSNTDPLVNSDGGTTWNSTTPTGSTWAKANDPCPSGWRVPTQAELQSLRDAGSQWTKKNGKNGRLYGSGDNSIFILAAASRSSDGTIYSVMGYYGDYWSNKPVGSEYAYYLTFSSTEDNMWYYYRTFGFSVRCVAD